MIYFDIFSPLSFLGQFTAGREKKTEGKMTPVNFLKIGCYSNIGWSSSAASSLLSGWRLIKMKTKIRFGIKHVVLFYLSFKFFSWSINTYTYLCTVRMIMNHTKNKSHKRQFTNCYCCCFCLDRHFLSFFCFCARTQARMRDTRSPIRWCVRKHLPPYTHTHTHTRVMELTLVIVRLRHFLP